MSKSIKMRQRKRRALHWSDQAGKDAFILLLAKRKDDGATLAELAAEFGLCKDRVGELVRMREGASRRTSGEHASRTS